MVEILNTDNHNDTDSHCQIQITIKLKVTYSECSSLPLWGGRGVTLTITDLVLQLLLE